METELILNFQKTIIIITVIVAIIVLSVIGIILKTSIYQNSVPPYGACPDKWELSGRDICINNAKSDGYFENVGTYISDVSCSTATSGTNLCSRIVGATGSSCPDGWVQGNTTNGLDSHQCYLLASHGTSPIAATNPSYNYMIKSPLKHQLALKLQDNVDWAKKNNISWDGLN
jgi:hypothetical protein